MKGRTLLVVACLVVAMGTVILIGAQEEPRTFGRTYAELDARRQQLVNDWIARFNKTTGLKLEPGPFYDTFIGVSTKTTFDAVTHAMMTSKLTDASGASLGDALALIEHVNAVRGEVAGTAGDRQFRMYARLKPDARSILERSKEFKRGLDNSVYHKGYPLNYREQGVPSIQISIARDNRQADIDVDYRTSAFPVSLFNGHLSAANSDVRAGNNAARHAARWAGFRDWWKSFFGVPLTQTSTSEETQTPALPTAPRAGKKNIDAMVDDFLRAWLVEGDIVAAMGYISPLSYACLALDAADPSAFDRGMAPFQLMRNLKSAYAALGAHDSLEGLTHGVRLSVPGLKVVQQPHHAQYVIYSVPDDIAASFECESRLSNDGARRSGRTYGEFFGSTFFINGRTNLPVALLWAQEDGYWKITSWKVGLETRPSAVPAVADVKLPHVPADPQLVSTVHRFLDAWMIKKDYDAALGYLSKKCYACYDLERDPEQPASTSPDDAGQKIRAGLQRTGDLVGKIASLDAVLSAVQPTHPATRIADHPYATTFTLTSIPVALANAAECDARKSGSVVIPDPLPLEYGDAYVLLFRLRAESGEGPVLRTLWRREDGAWRITSYDVESP